MGAARYRAAPPSARIERPLDVLTAIYHRTSGQTHLVAAPVPELLAALDDGEMSVEALFDRLAAEYDMGDADAAALTIRLDELVETGLVERL